MLRALDKKIDEKRKFVVKTCFHQFMSKNKIFCIKTKVSGLPFYLIYQTKSDFWKKSLIFRWPKSDFFVIFLTEKQGRSKESKEGQS